MSHEHGQALLLKVAEEAMIERGFLPEPPQDALAEAEAAHAGAPRQDLRSLPWTSIDNPDSLDLDQIEAVQETAEGTLLCVGIADVSGFVAPGGAIDGYAGRNTTSVYTGVRTFPMLPARLSYDRSSLLPGGPRPALVIETLVRPDGTRARGRVYPALVENRGKLDYPAVSAWLDGKGPPPGPLLNDAALRAQIEAQDRLARALGEARRRAGALDVDTCEVRAVVDARGVVTGLVPRERDRASRIVEELMIAANRTVAEALDGAGRASLRRVVRAPERWARLVSYAAERGFALPDQPSSQELARFVDRMRQSHDDDEFQEISLAVIKLMGRGEYAAHVPGQPEIGHFGLATDQYTHATAPNRRYPDLIMQRILHSLGGAAPYPTEHLAAIAARCSQQEAAADKVARRVRKSVAALLLSSQIGRVFAALITGASGKGTYLRTLGTPVEGKVVAGEEGLRVGDRVRARLVSVNIERGYIDFEVI